MSEIELKFQVPPESLAAVRLAMKAAAPRRQHLAATYFDTPDRQLASAGLALRLRQEGARWVQTLKGRGTHPAERIEHEVPRPRPSLGEPLRPLPSLHAGTPAAQAWERALGRSVDDFDSGALSPALITDIWRRALLVRGDTWAIELAFDEGEIRAGDSVVPVAELEYELKQGGLADLVAQASEGVRLHGLWLDTVSKAERGELLSRGQRLAAPVRFVPPELPRKADGPTLWQASLGAIVSMLLPNAAAVAAGAARAEHVHQLRVALRRLRVATEEIRPWSGAAGKPDWLAPLVGLFRGLGAGRDEAALQAAVVPRLAAAGAPLADWRHADSEPLPDPSTLVRARAVQQALLEVLAESRLPWAGGLSRDDTRRALCERFEKLHRQLIRAGRRFQGLADAERHVARKRAKRMRYLADLALPLVDKKGAGRRYLAALGKAQDALGEFQDLVAASPRYREAATTDSRAWFAVGWIAGELDGVVANCSQTLSALEELKPFW